MNDADEEGRTALHLAAGYGELGRVKAMIADKVCFGGLSLFMVMGTSSTLRTPTE